jgi:tRNA A58 N-methylase Trm61
VYIYAAEPLNQVEAQVNTALSEAAGGQAKVVAYTGEAQNKSYTNFNDNAADNQNDDNYYWLPKYDVRPEGTDAGKTNYIVLDLGTTETDISEISVRWHNRAFATKYKIETSDTCRVSGYYGRCK